MRCSVVKDADKELSLIKLLRNQRQVDGRLVLVLDVLDEYFPKDGLYFELFVSKINSYTIRN